MKKNSRTPKSSRDRRADETILLGRDLQILAQRQTAALDRIAVSLETIAASYAAAVKVGLSAWDKPKKGKSA